jgi:hypothetical protein
MREYKSTTKLCSSRTRTSSTDDPNGDRNTVQMLKMTTRLIHIFKYAQKILQEKRTYKPNDKQLSRPTVHMTREMAFNNEIQRAVPLVTYNIWPWSNVKTQTTFLNFSAHNASRHDSRLSTQLLEWKTNYPRVWLPRSKVCKSIQTNFQCIYSSSKRSTRIWTTDHSAHPYRDSERT